VYIAMTGLAGDVQTHGRRCINYLVWRCAFPYRHHSHTETVEQAMFKTPSATTDRCLKYLVRTRYATPRVGTRRYWKKGSCACTCLYRVLLCISTAQTITRLLFHLAPCGAYDLPRDAGAAALGVRACRWNRRDATAVFCDHRYILLVTVASQGRSTTHCVGLPCLVCHAGCYSGSRCARHCLRTPKLVTGRRAAGMTTAVARFCILPALYTRGLIMVIT